MSVNTYLVDLADAARDNAERRSEVARLIMDHGGAVLMATGGGSLIVSFDEAHLAAITASPLVARCWLAADTRDELVTPSRRRWQHDLLN